MTVIKGCEIHMDFLLMLSNVPLAFAPTFPIGVPYTFWIEGNAVHFAQELLTFTSNSQIGVFSTFWIKDNASSQNRFKYVLIPFLKILYLKETVLIDTSWFVYKIKWLV